MSAQQPQHWSQIDPADAVNISLPHPDIIGPRTTSGEECPWPWEPQQLQGAPIGQYHCPYCGEMVIAGWPHPDYGDLADETSNTNTNTNTNTDRSTT